MRLGSWGVRPRHRQVTGIGALGAVVALAGCSPAGPPPGPVSSSPPVTSSVAGADAVVIVSGLATQTPFTSSEAPCLSGLSAGNTASAMRDALVAAGRQVFTAPAQNGPGQVTGTSAPGPSGDCPPALPASVTIDTTVGIDRGGARLAAFVRLLHKRYGIRSVHFVGHSMGGLFSRSATGLIEGSPVTVRSLTTLGTPWTGAYPADYSTGALSLSECGQDEVCQTVLSDYETKLAQPEGPRGAASSIATARLQGPRGWNASQGDDLDDVPVTLIAGDRYQLDGGSPRVWPNDSVVARDSALASGIAGRPLRIRRCLVRPDVHTIGLAEQAGLPWTAALTWDPVVLDEVIRSTAPDDERAATRPRC